MANDKEIAIYYFSATGNSLKLSQDIASGLNGEQTVRLAMLAYIGVRGMRSILESQRDGFNIRIRGSGSRCCLMGSEWCGFYREKNNPHYTTV